jgi:hypothetical protein
MVQQLKLGNSQSICIDSVSKKADSTSNFSFQIFLDKSTIFKNIKITDATLDSLSQLTNSLKTLRLKGCIGLTNEGDYFLFIFFKTLTNNFNKMF